MVELKPNFLRLLVIWWSYMWRSLIVMGISFLIGSCIGLIGGFFIPINQLISPKFQIYVIFVNVLIGLIVSILPLKAILGKDFGSFRLVLLSNKSN